MINNKKMNINNKNGRTSEIYYLYLYLKWLEARSQLPFMAGNNSLSVALHHAANNYVFDIVNIMF